MVALRLGLGLALALFPLQALAQTAAPSPSPSPQPRPTPPPLGEYVSVEDEFSPHYYGESGSSNLVNWRAQVPYDDSAYLVRLKLPVVTGAPPESLTGAGDLAATNLAAIEYDASHVLAGVTTRFPTANDSLGSHKYSIGPAFGIVKPTGLWSFGFYSESYFSVIGPKSYPGVGKSKIAPVLSVVLPRGWVVGFSTMQFTYDYVVNRWTDVPVGLRLEHRGIFGLPQFRVYGDAERNFAHTSDTPSWTYRIGLRWTINGPP